MTRMTLVLAAALLGAAAPAFAAEEAGADNPMAGWKPPSLKNQAADRKEIGALIAAMDEAGKKGDLDAATALVDFPVLMLTDDSKGEAGGEQWSKEQWTQAMSPLYQKPMGGTMRHKLTVFVLTDSLATVTDEWSHTMGKKTMSGRSSSLLVRKGGKWLVKTMMEGGWGDSMKEGAAQAGAGAPAAPAEAATPK